MRELNKRYWPYKVQPDYDDEKINSAVKWCHTSLPKDRWRIVGSNRFYFVREKDALWFTLKWL